MDLRRRARRRRSVAEQVGSLARRGAVAERQCSMTRRLARATLTQVEAPDPDSNARPQRVDLDKLTIEPGIHCASCHRVCPITIKVYRRQLDLYDPNAVESIDLFDQFFSGEVVTCWFCDAPMDLWERCAEAIDNNHAFGFGVSLVGGTQTVFDFRIARDELVQIDLATKDVPPLASVLSVNCTVNTEGQEHSVYPVPVLGNRIASRMRIPHRLAFHGRAFPGTDPLGRSLVHCFVSWHVAPDGDDGWSHLLDALTDFADGDLRGAIVPANIAAESSLTASISASMRGWVGAQRVERTLVDAGYANILKTLMPFVCGALELPVLDATIVSRLDHLRDFRNKVAHRGAFEKEPTRTDVRDLLVAAVFGFRYGRHLRDKIASQGRAPVPDAPSQASRPPKAKKQRVSRGRPPTDATAHSLGGADATPHTVGGARPDSAD